MSAADVTPDIVDALRSLSKEDYPAMTGNLLVEILDALESAWAERDRLRAELEQIKAESEWLKSESQFGTEEDRLDREAEAVARIEWKRHTELTRGCTSVPADDIGYWERRIARRQGRDEASAETEKLRAELSRLSADGMPRDREELQKLLNDAYRTGNQEAHEAHRLVREMGLSAQGGEVPPLTQEDAHKELLRVSRENTYNGAEEAAFWNGYEFAQSRARPAPPHPDTVEVSREMLERLADLQSPAHPGMSPHEAETAYLGQLAHIRSVVKNALRAQPSATPPRDVVEVSREEWTIAQILANAWSLHPLKCSERDKLVSEWDAMRSSAQPTTNETRG